MKKNNPYISVAIPIYNEEEVLPHLYKRIVSLLRNFGHQIAITAGMSYSKGDAVVVMDGDLQDPPELIPEFIDKWAKGNKVVYAIRNKRKEFIIKRFAYFAIL